MSALELFAPEATPFAGVQLRWTPAGVYTITVDGRPAITIHPGTFDREGTRALAEGMAEGLRRHLETRE